MRFFLNDHNFFSLSFQVLYSLVVWNFWNNAISHSLGRNPLESLLLLFSLFSIFLRLYPRCLFHLCFLPPAHRQVSLIQVTLLVSWLVGFSRGYLSENSRLPLVILSKCIVNNMGNSWACKRASQSPGIGYGKCSSHYTLCRFIVQLHRVREMFTKSPTTLLWGISRKLFFCTQSNLHTLYTWIH